MIFIASVVAGRQRTNSKVKDQSQKCRAKPVIEEVKKSPRQAIVNWYSLWVKEPMKRKARILH